VARATRSARGIARYTRLKARVCFRSCFDRGFVQGNQPADRPVKRGTVFHEHFYGAKAVPFIGDSYLNLQVWCKEDAGGTEDEIRYGIAISIEAEGAIPIYDEIEQRLRVAPRP
jgi:hypothetical protein